MVAEQLSQEQLAERRFARTVLILITLGFATVAFAGLSAIAMMLRGEEQTNMLTHTYQVEREVAGVRLAIEQMRSARRGMVLRLPGATRAAYDDAVAELRLRTDRVAGLTADNPVQQANVARLRPMIARLDQLFLAPLSAHGRTARASEAERQQLAMRVQALAMRMLAEEQRLLDARSAARSNAVESFYIVLAATAALLMIVGGGSIWIIRRYTAELSTSRNALRELNENLEAAVNDRTRDLRRANDEIQRFAYIVSHDLRSPLVNVMGFTAEMDSAIAPLKALIERARAEAPDLVDREVELAVDEDLPEAVAFIRSSTQKMDRLINAILRLSREGRRTIAPEPLDLNAVVAGAVGALRHRIDELGVTVHVAPLPSIVSDRVAVEQVVSNLLENAVKYLKPGRAGEIRIEARSEHGRVLIDIGDNGRGIAPRDHERIFDLFRRSGEQDQPGEGIGLAHVRALAYRLGGTISVASELDQGATFTINLPESYTGEKSALT